MELILLLIAGAAALTVGGFAAFDGDEDQAAGAGDDDPSELNEGDIGELLFFEDGPDVVGTEGDDTIIATGDLGGADAPPDGFTLDLRGGDDEARLSYAFRAEISTGEGDDTVVASGVSDSSSIDLGDGDDYANVDNATLVRIDGGEGDDEIRVSGLDSTIEGGVGDDVLTSLGPNEVFGGPGDDVVDFTDYGSNYSGAIDAGSGDDTVHASSRAEITSFSYFGGASDQFAITAGEGADELNVKIQVGVVDETVASYRATNGDVSNEFITREGELRDFNPVEDSLRIDIAQDAENAGRTIDVSLVAPMEDGGVYRLEFDIAANGNSEAFKSFIEITAVGPLTLDDIEIVGPASAAEETTQSITVSSEDETGNFS